MTMISNNHLKTVTYNTCYINYREDNSTVFCSTLQCTVKISK